MTSNGTDPIADELQAPAFADGIPFARPIARETVTPPSPPFSEFLLSNESRRSAWADVGWLALFVVAFEFFASGFAHLVGELVLGAPISPEDADALQIRQAMLFPAISLRALAAIVIIALLARRRGQTAQSVGLSWSGLPLHIAIGLGALVVAYGLIAVTMQLLWFLWPDMPNEMVENARRIMELVPKLGLLEFIPLTAIIGVYEELVFRGFLMTRLRRATGGWTVAVMVSTAVFTALHAFDQTRAALVVVAILSLVFSLVTIWRRSIVPAIVAHTLFDLSQLIFLDLQAGDSWT